MKMLNRLAVTVASAAFFIGAAHAQNGGTAANHAFAIGKGVGVQGYTSLLCGSAQLAVGQAAADPICRTISGDVTINAAGVTALGNIPSGATMAGSLLATAIAAPSTPAAGKASLYVDSISKNIAAKNDAGTINHGVQTKAAVASNWLRSIGDDGSVGASQPAFSDVSGSFTCAQKPAESGGDVTSPAGSCVLSIGATKVVSAMLNADVFSTAHSWSGQQTLAAPIFTGVNDNQGAHKDSAQPTPAQITADQNDYNPGTAVCSSTTTLIINSDAARNITGIAGGVAGCDLFLINNGVFPITLKDGSASSLAANRFTFGGDFVLASKAAAHIKYDGNGSTWRNTTGSATGGGGGGVSQVVCGSGLTGGTITSSGTCAVDADPFIGSIEWKAFTRTPTNFVKADGSSLSRSAPFDKLFTKLVFSSTVTFTNGSADIGWTAHGLSPGDPVKFFTTGTLPTNFTAGTHGFAVGTEFCVIATGLTTNTFRVAATCGGTAITAGSAGSGTQTAVNAPWGDGDGSTTYTVPDLRGEFVRSFDSARGVDTNRRFGQDQLDAFQGHRHSNSASITPSGVLGFFGSGTIPGNTGGSSTNPIGVSVSVLDPTNDGTNGTPRSGTETRPRNQTLMPFIRFQ